jgi:hypothetical protein
MYGAFGNQPSTVMNSEFSNIDQDKMVSPHAQEVEYALHLSHMINTVKDDPAQMRLAIYEFARARLKIDTSWAETAERDRLSAALETAILGVEQFSTRREETGRLPPPPAQIALGTAPAGPSSTSMVSISRVNSTPNSRPAPNESYFRYDTPVIEVPTQGLVSKLTRLSIVILLFGVVAVWAIYSEQMPVLRGSTDLPASTAAPQSNQRQNPVPADAKVAAAGLPPFPLPSDYGVYALNDAALIELRLLPEQVPDNRVAVSTPINRPSRTTLPDGKAKFVIFRRDVADNAPDRIEVRVVARVVRALTFDAKGKASFSPVSDAWNIRNVSYEFRVRPIAGNPEMLLVQPENADFTLPAGRYVLALKYQGYDFTVAGNVTDPSQCLERTDAANGVFFSDCK